MSATIKVYEGVSHSTRERITRLIDSRASAILDGRTPPRGFSELMDATPMELKLEHIYPLLDPADLVQLTQTSREHKDLLFSPSAQSVWRAALARMRGLPACPDDLNEAQYADLIFGTGCHLCGNEHGKYTFWEVRVRMCYACLAIEGRVISSYLRGVCHTHSLYPEELTPILPKVLHRSGDITTQITHGATATATLRAYAAVLLQRDSREAARWLARTMEALEPLLAHADACKTWLHEFHRKNAMEHKYLVMRQKEWVVILVESMNCADTFTAMRAAGFIERAPQDIEEVAAICQRPFTREGMEAIRLILQDAVDQFQNVRDNWMDSRL